MLQRCVLCLSDMLCFSSVSLRPPLPDTQSALIGQLAHAWASTDNSNRADVLNQFLHDKMQGINCASVWQSDMCDVTKSQN